MSFLKSSVCTLNAAFGGVIFYKADVTCVCFPIHYELLGDTTVVLEARAVLVDVQQRRRVLLVLLPDRRRALRALAVDLAGVAGAVNQARLLQ